MALDTVRSNKMRSALTVLGVVIGITSIVGMTALIRGFDESIKDLLRTSRPDHDHRHALQHHQLRQRRRAQDAAEASEPDDLRCPGARSAGDDRSRSSTSSSAPASVRAPSSASSTAIRRPSSCSCSGPASVSPRARCSPSSRGRFFNGTEVQYRKNVVVLGNTAYKLLFEPSGTDPIGKMVRVGSERFEVVASSTSGRRRRLRTATPTISSPFRTPPTSASIGLRSFNIGAHWARSAISRFTVLPHEASARRTPLDDVRRVMRIRHGLKLDEPDDFDLGTQDSLMQLYNPISQATFFALIVISSIALMVGGIGVMAIMSITVTERTREIGVRKALGARRVEILFQFLMEAAVLTSVGGILGIALGSLDRPGRPLSPASPSRCPGGRSPSASASPRRSASSSACIRPSRPHAWTRSKRFATNSHATISLRLVHAASEPSGENPSPASLLASEFGSSS